MKYPNRTVNKGVKGMTKFKKRHTAIDKTLCLLYNVFVIVYILSSFCANAQESEEINIHLHTDKTEESDIFCVYLMCEDEYEICGLTLDVVYNNEKMEFTSAYKGEGACYLQFSCSLEDDGRVRILFDGAVNQALTGEIAVLGFKMNTDEILSQDDLFVVFPFSVNAFKIDQDKICSISVKAIVETSSETEQNRESTKMQYVGYQLSENGKIRLVGIVNGNVYCAGFEMRIANLSNGSVIDCFLYADALKYNIFASKKSAEDYGGDVFYCCEVPIPCEGTLAVYFRPVASFDSVSLISGDDFLIIFKDGNVLLHEKTNTMPFGG